MFARKTPKPATPPEPQQHAANSEPKECSASPDCYWEPCGPGCKGWDTSNLD